MKTQFYFYFYISQDVRENLRLPFLLLLKTLFRKKQGFVSKNVTIIVKCLLPLKSLNIIKRYIYIFKEQSSLILFYLSF